MEETIKIASWNIAAGRTNKSLSQFDYDQENISYFSNLLKTVEADIICLQETHYGENKDIGKEIANELAYPFYYTNPGHESHIDNKLKLSNSILAKTKPLSIEAYILPYPEFELYWPNGNPAKRYEKSLLCAKFKGFNVYNTQLIPLGLFGVLYGDEKAKIYSQNLEVSFKNVLEAPLLICGDFSGDFPDDKPQLVFSELFTSLSLMDSIPHQITRPKNDGLIHQTDHIYFSDQSFSCISSEVIPTQSDHYLCTATFKFKSKNK